MRRPRRRSREQGRGPGVGWGGSFPVGQSSAALLASQQQAQRKHADCACPRPKRPGRGRIRRILGGAESSRRNRKDGHGRRREKGVLIAGLYGACRYSFTSSTQRFLALPAFVVLSAKGLVWPKPAACRRLAAVPAYVSEATTDRARASLSCWLWAGVLVLSCTARRRSGLSASSFCTSASTG